MTVKRLLQGIPAFGLTSAPLSGLLAELAMPTRREPSGREGSSLGQRFKSVSRMKPAPSSLRETALFGHGNEIAQVTEFHRSYPYLEGMVQSYKVFVYGPIAPIS